MNFEKPQSFVGRVLSYLGADQLGSSQSEVNTNEAPNAFAYSLFYVYYDQYTYIRGVLAENALIAIAAIIFAL